MDKVTHIIVPISGNPEDEVAVGLACLFGKKYKAKITVVYVVEVKRALPLDSELPAESEHGQRLLDQAEEMSRHLDSAVDLDLLQARAAGPAIVDEATALHADLIVMGLPFHARFGSYQLGETSNYVLSHATCRVWLIRDRNYPALEATH